MFFKVGVMKQTLRTTFAFALIIAFRHLAQLCGFEIENIFGDYFRTPFTENSKEMIWVLRKP